MPSGIVHPLWCCLNPLWLSSIIGTKAVKFPLAFLIAMGVSWGPLLKLQKDTKTL